MEGSGAHYKKLSMQREKRVYRVQTRISPTEYLRLKEMAAQEKMSVSDLIRAKVIYQRLPHRITDVARKTYLELGRIGNNLNQIARTLHLLSKLGKGAEQNLLSELQENLTDLYQVVSQTQHDIIGLGMQQALDEIQEDLNDDSEATSS